MEDNYYIDLKAINLEEYEKELQQAELLPSRKILKEDIKRRFACLSKHGIKSLNDLMAALSTPEKLRGFSRQTGLPEEYLAILKREIGSSQPKPVNLKDFPGIPTVTVQKLAEIGINNTKQLFDLVKTESARRALSSKTGISDKTILELTKLTDVSRIRWVGANFARLLVDSECDTVEKVTKANHAKLYDELMRINGERKYFKGKFGVNDMRLCVIAAKDVPKAIQY